MKVQYLTTSSSGNSLILLTFLDEIFSPWNTNDKAVHAKFDQLPQMTYHLSQSGWKLIISTFLFKEKFQKDLAAVFEIRCGWSKCQVVIKKKSSWICVDTFDPKVSVSVLWHWWSISVKVQRQPVTMVKVCLSDLLISETNKMNVPAY